eukprot:189012_1
MLQSNIKDITFSDEIDHPLWNNHIKNYKWVNKDFFMQNLHHFLRGALYRLKFKRQTNFDDDMMAKINTKTTGQTFTARLLFILNPAVDKMNQVAVRVSWCFNTQQPNTGGIKVDIVEKQCKSKGTNDINQTNDNSFSQNCVEWAAPIRVLKINSMGSIWKRICAALNRQVMIVAEREKKLKA